MSCTINFYGKIRKTIDKLCNNDYNEIEWFTFSNMFCIKLLYKKYNFYHNDLHNQNVMYQKN